MGVSMGLFDEIAPYVVVLGDDLPERSRVDID
jgi:hypothetical protein